MEKVLIVGVGDLGSHLLEFIARDDNNLEWIIGDLDINKVKLLCNNATIGAAHHGKNPVLVPKKIDLLEIDKTANLIKKEKPIAVINCTVLHTWHLIRKLPENIYKKISSAGLGAWLPCQLTLAMYLARAIKESGENPYYINTSLSCLTNPVMGKIGLAPTIGVGNIDLIAPAIIIYLSKKTGIDRSKIDIRLVCHHQHWVYPREAGYKGGAPYFLKIMINGEVVTDQFNTDIIMYESVKMYPEGLSFTTVSASSAIKNLKALIYNQGILTHSPGPNGLPGGYPVILSAYGAEIHLPNEITIEQAIRINEDSGKLDSIEEIKDDGTVIFTEYAYNIMKEVLGFDCRSFTPNQSKNLAFEQMVLFKELANKYIK
ncbi:MAG: hypothetical protein CMG74_03765 [Candidatus Marinimicrobia bacterium]|nr:hypothetical protein [Candidatus Neomarinimicrobiota bacterium]|tara:strand:+ start:1404 stop:2522 length:1119 start_codon:yes stop_codon:yes gene_type:complete